MQQKSLQTFVRKHRKEIDRVIAAFIAPNKPYGNDEERRLWVLNDEGLYNWARNEGVKIKMEP